MSELPFGFERPEDSPGYLLWQVTITWQRLIKKVLDEHDISHAQFVIMAQVLWFEGNNYQASQTLISQWTKLDKMTVSKSLKRLAGMGLIQRTEDEKDTRAKTTSLTTKGRALVTKLVPLVEKIDQDFFATATASEQKTWLGIMNKLLS